MRNQKLDEEAIFHVASKLDDPGDRSDYLDQVCGDDVQLRKRVRGCSTWTTTNRSFFESPPEACRPLTCRPSLNALAP